MLPIKDINPRRRFPIVNITIILLNCLFFMFELKLGPRLEQFILYYGLIPANVTTAVIAGTLPINIIVQFFSSIFLHGGWMHLMGNMLFLWIFGDNVEDKLGHGRYLFFYLSAGVVASIVHIIVAPYSPLPTIGASGAIAGVLGAYLILFPHARVLTLIPIFIFIQVAELPAFLLIVLWFVTQFLNGLLSLGIQSVDSGGVAWWAHIGGFIYGVVLAIPLRKYR
jgi:membrane associated rhomboid family serine protease